MLVNPNAITAVAELLTTDDFYRDTHRLIYRGVLTLFERGEEVDVVTISSAARARGHARARRARLRPHAGRVRAPWLRPRRTTVNIGREQSVLRSLIRVGNEIAELGYQHPGDPSDLLDRSASRRCSPTEQARSVAEFEHIKQVLVRNFEHLATLDGDRGVTGVATGFEGIDKLTGGFQKANLIVLAARPGVGKTSLALNIAQHIATEGAAPGGGKRAVAIFSLMSAEELGERLMCSGRVSSHKLRTGSLSPDDHAKLVQAGLAARRPTSSSTTRRASTCSSSVSMPAPAVQLARQPRHRRLPSALSRRPRGQPPAGGQQHLPLAKSNSPASCRCPSSPSRSSTARPKRGRTRSPS